MKKHPAIILLSLALHPQQLSLYFVNGGAVCVTMSACLITYMQHTLARDVFACFVCVIVCMCVCTRGVFHSVRPPAARAAGGSHSPHSDSSTGIVRTVVAGACVVERNLAKYKKKGKYSSIYRC